MSNVFRSLDMKRNRVELRKIGIRNLAQVEGDVKNDSAEFLEAERKHLIEQARLEMDEEKKNIDQLRKAALDDISKMQKAWEDEKIVLQQQAYDEGFQMGFGEGRDKALSEMASSIQLANQATEESYENAKQYQASQERVILELGVRSAERILGETLEEDEEKFLAIVKRALKEVREMKEVKLYVSLDYFNLLTKNRSELAAIFPPDVPFLIFVNEEFESTECYIETNHGRIVVSIDEQLNELRKQLVELLENGD